MVRAFNTTGPDCCRQSKRFNVHQAWLHGNIERRSWSLQASLQIMYKLPKVSVIMIHMRPLTARHGWHIKTPNQPETSADRSSRQVMLIPPTGFRESTSGWRQTRRVPLVSGSEGAIWSGPWANKALGARCRGIARTVLFTAKHGKAKLRSRPVPPAR